VTATVRTQTGVQSFSSIDRVTLEQLLQSWMDQQLAVAEHKLGWHKNAVNWRV